MRSKRFTLIIMLVFAVVGCSFAQQNRLQGVVVDEETGDSLPLVTMQYKKRNEMFTSNKSGLFNIPRREKYSLSVSAVGYKERKILINANSPRHLRIELKPDLKRLQQVEVKTKRRKYSRKENPAVTLMRKVVAQNKANNLKETHAFYRYMNYQKLTLAVNDISPRDVMKEKSKRKRQWLLNQVMTCPQNGKLILPFTMEETVTECAYRQASNTERNTVIGMKSHGVNQLVETGQIINKVASEVFADVDIYQDQVYLLQYPFASPIGSGAINFYRYYIVDTLMVGGDRCIRLEFLPNNIQDFGFRGNLYVLDDSTLHVRRCELTIPKKSDVNWVEEIKIDLEYEKLETGEWVLTKDDMFCELSVLNLLPKAVVFRTTRRTDYSFDPLPDALFSGFGKQRKQEDAGKRDDDFWQRHRTALLTPSEEHMEAFIDGMKSSKGFGILLAGFKIFTENFIELGSEEHPSKVDLGPINTLISNNFVDGLRTRLSLATTGNLSKHWFLKGYAARGWKSDNNYYSAALTYSFNKKDRIPDEYPKRKVVFTSAYDNMAPSDRFGSHDKDNIFTMLKWSKDDKRLFYNQKKIAFDYEQYGGMEYMFHYNWERQHGVGTIEFPDMQLSEFQFGVRFSPGESTINTKQTRVKLNFDSPVYELSHTVGVPGFLGGTERYNRTDLYVYNRFWLNNWGKLSVMLRGGVVWNKVHYMLLLEPPANTSYIVQRHTFNLMQDMEFLNDRYAMLDVYWDMYGKLFNRIPLVKKLKLREYLGFKAMWGTLTEKNSSDLPEGCHIMEKDRPYMEFIVGVHNIFKFFHIQYVRRLNYNELETAHKHGVRVKFETTF